MSEYQPNVNLIEFMKDKDRVLEKPCEKVSDLYFIDKKTEEIDHIIEDMRATMHFYHGVAIAAPQVGKSVQIIVINSVVFNSEEDIVIINPEIEMLTAEKKMEMEFCLSFPEGGKYVSRYLECQIKGFDRKMQQSILYADTPIRARILQHEFDHLQGKIL